VIAHSRRKHEPRADKARTVGTPFSYALAGTARPARPSGQRWNATHYTIDFLERLRG